MIEDFEYVLLKKLTHSSEFFNKAFPILKKEFFQKIGNQELISLVHDYYGKYKNTPSLTELVASVKNVPNTEIRSEIIESLKQINETEEVASVDFMCDETLSWAKDALYYEALRFGSDGLMKRDDALKLKAQQIMDERAKLTIDSDLGLEFDDIDTMIEYYSARNIGILTQHKELNKRLGSGFLPGTLSVILAAQGVGKSLLMTDLVSGMIKDGKNILLVSLEMADKEIMKRVHANAMELPINSLLDLSKTEGELADLKRPILDKEKIMSAYNKMKLDGSCGKFFVKDYPSGSFSALMLENLVETYKLEKNININIVFIDYLGIMKSDLLSPSAGLYSYVKSIGEEVRASAKKMNIATVSASQLNRGSVNNVTDADNSNVSDSLGTAMTADFMLFLLQNEEMKERNEIVAKCTKNRFNGRTDTWSMMVDYNHMAFHDMLIQGDAPDINISETLGISDTDALSDDFGIITPQKQKDAEEFAKNEIREIVGKDFEILNKSNEDKKDPFDGSIESLYKELDL